MKLFILCGVFILSFLLTNAEARKSNGKGRGGKNSDGNSTMECLGQNVVESKYSFGLSECTEEILSNQPDLSDKPQKKKKAMKRNQMCIKLCQRKKQGILDSNGKLSEAGVNRFVEDLFPQKAHTRIERGLTRCAEDHGEGFAVTNNCKEYKRFEKCMSRIITKACGLKNGKQSGGGRDGKNAGRRNGNKGKNKNSRRQQSEISEHGEDDEESEVEE